METALNIGTFEVLDNREMMEVDGGFGVTITAALIGLGAVCFTGGLAAGVAIGLNKKNRG